MYLQGVITVDPSQLTHMNLVKPTKGFARIAHLLTAGLVSAREEQETFCAVAILQQINVVMRSLDIDNVVRIAKDDTVFYDDREGKEGDLKEGLELFAQGMQKEDNELFDTLTLVLEHPLDQLHCLIEIMISRVHPAGEYPIKVVVNGMPSDLNAKQGEEAVRNRLQSVFSSQSNYDDFVVNHKNSFGVFISQIAAAFRTEMKVDDVKIDTRVKLVRPKQSVKSRNDVPASRRSRNSDPIYDDYYGNDDMFFYAWIWSENCYVQDIHCRDCVIVDEQGEDVVDVGMTGFQAGQCDTLNPDAAFVAPESGTAHDGHQYDSDLAAASTDTTSGGDSGGGWLSSLADSFGGDSDGGSSCGSSCGGGCGGD